jgi:hypothetical protein
MNDNDVYNSLRDWYITEQVRSRKKKEYFVRQLTNKGMDREKAQFLIDSIDAEYQAMMKDDPFEPNYTFKTWRWLITAFVVLIVWMVIIPFHFYYKSPGLLSFVGAILFALFLGKFFLSIRTPIDYLGFDDKRKIYRHKFSPYMFIPGLIMLLIFYQVRVSQRNSLLRAEGIVTTAIVAGGKSEHHEAFSIRRGNRSSDTNYLRLKVNLQNGKTLEARQSVGTTEYMSSFDGQLKPVVYLEEMPNELILLPISNNPDPYKGPRTSHYEEYAASYEEHAKAAMQAYNISLNKKIESYK